MKGIMTLIKFRAIFFAPSKIFFEPLRGPPDYPLDGRWAFFFFFLYIHTIFLPLFLFYFMRKAPPESFRREVFGPV